MTNLYCFGNNRFKSGVIFVIFGVIVILNGRALTSLAENAPLNPGSTNITPKNAAGSSDLISSQAGFNTFVNCGRVSIAYGETNWYALGRNRSCAITAGEGRANFGRISLKMTVYTTNSESSHRASRSQSETLETTVAPQRTNLLSFDGIVFILTPIPKVCLTNQDRLGKSSGP